MNRFVACFVSGKSSTLAIVPLSKSFSRRDNRPDFGPIDGAMPLFSRTLSRRRRRLLVPCQSRSAEEAESSWLDVDGPALVVADDTGIGSIDTDALLEGEVPDATAFRSRIQSGGGTAARMTRNRVAEPATAEKVTAERRDSPSTDSLDEISELIAAARTLQHQFHELAQRQLHLMRRIADSVDEKTPIEILREIERLQPIVSEPDAGSSPIMRLPACDSAANHTQRPRPQVSLEARGSSSHYGRIAQRIALHQQQQSSVWRRFWRWIVRSR